MRTFIAIDLPQPLKENIDQIQTDLKQCDLSFKWVKAENIHLTLKFLGNIEEKQLDDIKKIITEVAQNHKALEVTFTQFGFFPNDKTLSTP